MGKYLSIIILLGIITLMGVLAAREKPEGPDTGCISDCMSRGFSAGYCPKRCSTDADIQAANAELADPVCMHHCTSAGQKDDYCRKPCTY